MKKTVLGESFFCTVLRHKMLLLQAVYEYTPWSNSLFCTVLRHKTLQAVHLCTP